MNPKVSHDRTGSDPLRCVLEPPRCQLFNPPWSVCPGWVRNAGNGIDRMLSVGDYHKPCPTQDLEVGRVF